MTHLTKIRLGVEDDISENGVCNIRIVRNGDVVNTIEVIYKIVESITPLGCYSTYVGDEKDAYLFTIKR